MSHFLSILVVIHSVAGLFTWKVTDIAVLRKINESQRESFKKPWFNRSTKWLWMSNGWFPKNVGHSHPSSYEERMTFSELFYCPTSSSDCWCLQMGSCLPCLWEETIWTPSASRIHNIICQFYQKAQSSPVVTCLLTFSEMAEPGIGPYRTKCKCRQVVNLDINCHLHRLVSC